MSSATNPESRGPEDLCGRVLEGRYRLDRVLGRGGMGTAYLAYDTRMERKVVVKVPHARFLEEEGFLERFEREIRSQTRLPHPHIVKALDTGAIHRGEGTAPTPYAVLEYLEGGSLRDRLGPEGTRQSPQQVAEWLLPVCQALDFIHEQGYLHRDVKPGNVIFDGSGHAFLADFGIVKAKGSSDASLTDTGMIPGSPDYMGPEAVLGAEPGPAYDQYAVAVMTYEALAGRRPHLAPTPMAVVVARHSSDAPDLAALTPHVPARACACVMRALDREPAQRFSSCTSFARQFIEALPKGRDAAFDSHGRMAVPVLPPPEASRAPPTPLPTPGGTTAPPHPPTGGVLADRTVRAARPTGSPPAPAASRTPTAGAGRPAPAPAPIGPAAARRAPPRRWWPWALAGCLTTLAPASLFLTRLLPAPVQGWLEARVPGGGALLGLLSTSESHVASSGPHVRVLQPSDGAVLASRDVVIAGRLEAGSDAILLVNGVPVVRTGSGFEATLRVVDDGPLGIRLTLDGQMVAEHRVTIDTRPPTIELELPTEPTVDLAASEPDVRVRGRAVDTGLREVLVAGTAVEHGPSGEFDVLLPIPEGESREVVIAAVDMAGNRATPVVRTVRRAKAPAPAPFEAAVTAAVRESLQGRWEGAKTSWQAAVAQGATEHDAPAALLEGLRAYDADPVLVVTEPAEGATVATGDVRVRGRLASGRTTDEVYVNGAPARTGLGAFEVMIPLGKATSLEIGVSVVDRGVPRGPSITRKVTLRSERPTWAPSVDAAETLAALGDWGGAKTAWTKAAGQGARASDAPSGLLEGIRRYDAAPRLTVNEPTDGSIVREEHVWVRGTLDSGRGTDEVLVDGKGVPLRLGKFQVRVPLTALGLRRITVSVVDRGASRGEPAVITVTREAAVPAAASTFLSGWADPVGDDRDRTTGYPTRIRRRVDHAEMVLIPGGAFTLGAVSGDPQAQKDERPAKRVTLSPYYLDEYEVTVGMWSQFCSATGKTLPKGLLPEATHAHPIHAVTFDEVVAYVRWAGVTLPTEAQWERAAKGDREDGVFPWGPMDIPNRRNGKGGEDGFDGLAPVGRFPANEFDLYDMSGNVAELCLDAYQGDAYANAAARDPAGPTTGPRRVARGGAWSHIGRFLRTTVRYDLGSGESESAVGFRCCISLPAP